MKTKIILISIITIVCILLVSLTFAWTPPSDGDGLGYLAMENFTNMSAEYFVGDGSYLTGLSEGGFQTDQNAALNTTGSPTFATINTGQGANELYDMNQNVLTTSDVEFAKILVDQNTDNYGITIDSEATTVTNYALTVQTGIGAHAARFISNPNIITYLAMDVNHGEGANWFYRNYPASWTNEPVVFIEQDEAGDDQDALVIQQDGSGDYLTAGSFIISKAGLVTGTQFSGAQDWTDNQNYPIACPAGTAVTTIGDSNTCTTFTQADQTLDTDDDVGFRNVSVTNCITSDTNTGKICWI